MKRVLFVLSQPFFQWRGSPIRVSFNLRALSELGYEVDLLVPPIGEDVDIPNVRIVRTAALPGIRDLRIGPSPAKLVFDVLLLLRGLSLARRIGYDAVHGVEDAGVVGALIARLSKTPFIFEKHSDPASHRRGLLRNAVLALYGAVERMTMRRADAVITTGVGLAGQVADIHLRGTHWCIADIPSSLAEASEDGRRRVRQRLDPSGDRVLAAFVGSFAVYQGVDLLLESVPFVLRRRPDVHVVIIGGSPLEIEQKRLFLKERGADGAVTFLGKIAPAELPDVLAACDLLLSPRVAGVNSPLKVLDYFKAGRPIVATDTAANRCLLDNDTALLVLPEPEALAEGMLRMADDEALRQRLGANGRRLIDERYNFNVFRRRLGDCYRGLWGGPVEADGPRIT